MTSSPTSSRTSAPAATSWPCAAGTSPTPTSTPSTTTTSARCRHVRRRADLRRPVRPVLRLQAPRDGPHRLVHLRPGPRHRDARHGDVSPMTDTTTRPATTVALDIGGMTCASCAARITKRLNKLDGVDAIRELRHRTGHRHRPRRRHRRGDRRPGRSDRLHRQGPRRIAARHQRQRGRRPRD